MGPRGRTVPAVYCVVAVGLVLAVIAVAYGTQAPTLAVAEFAPAARQQVAPPPTTTPDPGRAGSGGHARRPTTTSTTSAVTPTTADVAGAAPTTQVSRSRPCVGNPPRQTDDPQSPPCVATIFDGDNGGGTSMGVTGTEIQVAVPTYDAAGDAAVRLLFDYFNQKYEFYGRRLVPAITTFPISDAVQQRATAATLAERRVFAAMDHSMIGTYPASALHQELARKGVISLIGRETSYTDALLYDELHPYVWGAQPSAEQIWDATGELVCKALAGWPASHAGGSLVTQSRKFGVVIEAEFQEAPVPLTLNHRKLLQALEACGVNPVISQVRHLRDTSVEGRVALTKMKDEGVTSIICACYHGTNYLIQAARVVGGFEPEILLPDLGFHIEAAERDLQNVSLTPWARHVFGVYFQPKSLPFQARPFFGAIRQMDAAFSLVQYHFLLLEEIYRELLILAAGVQGAGPNLTPATFAAGLMTTQFPNPGAGAAPYWQSAVRFGPGDHTLNSDVALAWWDPTAATTSVVGGPRGSWCFLAAGARFSPGQIPADADSRFFSSAEACR